MSWLDFNVFLMQELISWTRFRLYHRLHPKILVDIDYVDLLLGVWAGNHKLLMIISLVTESKKIGQMLY
jgi:hypothetical protein